MGAGQGVLPHDSLASVIPMPAIDAELGEITKPEVRPFGEVAKGYAHFINGDVLFAKITPCMENGKVAVAKNLVKRIGCGTTEFHVLRPLCGMPSEYIYYHIRQESFRNKAEANMTGTAGQLRVPLNFLKCETIPIPPLTEQQSIIE